MNYALAIETDDDGQTVLRSREMPLSKPYCSPVGIDALDKASLESILPIGMVKNLSNPVPGSFNPDVYATKLAMTCNFSSATQVDSDSTKASTHV